LKDTDEKARVLKRVHVIAVVLSLLLSFAGLAYLLYLNILFPRLIAGYGGRERFSLSKVSNYTFEIPLYAYSRVHLRFEANETIELRVDGYRICDCRARDLVVEPGEEVLISLKSSSPASGMLTAWQEIPLDKQMSAWGLFLTGLVSAVISVKIGKGKLES